MQTESQRQALVVALPPLVFGLGITAMFLVIVPLDRLVIGGASPPIHVTGLSLRFAIGLAVGLIMVTVLAVGGLVAAVRRLPGWGYTWVGADLMGLLLVLMVIGDDREFLISPAADIALLALFLLAGLAALTAAALRGWQQAGLVSIGLATTVGLSLCFFVTAGPFNRFDLALLAGPLGLLVAALTYAYACGADSTRIAVLVSMGLLNAALLWMAEQQVWQPWYLSHGEPGHFWPWLAVLTALLLIGPMLSLVGRPLHRVLRRA